MDICQSNTREPMAVHPGGHSGELILESAGLSKVPTELLTTRFTHLCLARNQIETMSSSIWNSLSSLVVLDLSRNHLTMIPSGIAVLSLLQELNLLSNCIKMSTLPVQELASMSQLQVLDLRYNEKLQKQEAAASLRRIFGGRVRVIAKGCQSRPAEVVAGSACDRDSSELADQLAPWSTPHLRRRLESLFGVIADPEAVKRDELLQLLIREYNARGPRVIRQHEGTRVDPKLIAELTACLRNLSWPTTTRERPKVQAERYFTIQVPNTKFTVEGGKKARLNAVKLQKYAVLWELILHVLRSVDPHYADMFTGVAVTMGFTDSPHIDTENIGPFYGISLGNFSGGGHVAVESHPLEITYVNTFERLGRVDGRYPHWVTPYTGERYSIIYYRTVGAADPMGPAVFQQAEKGMGFEETASLTPDIGENSSPVETSIEVKARSIAPVSAPEIGECCENGEALGLIDKPQTVEEYSETLGEYKRVRKI